VLTCGQGEPARITVKRVKAISASVIHDAVQRALRQPPTVTAVDVTLTPLASHNKTLD
jgi:hypothetical protein